MSRSMAFFISEPHAPGETTAFFKGCYNTQAPFPVLDIEFKLLEFIRIIAGINLTPH